MPRVSGVRSAGPMRRRRGALEPPDAPLLSRDFPGGQFAALVVVGVAYYLGARIGLSLSLVERNVTPLWPPTGIALAAYILLGRSVWPAVAVAALAVNLPISAGLLPAATTSAGNTLAPLVAVSLLTRVGFRRQLDRRSDALALVFIAALGSMIISATIGAATLLVSGRIHPDGFFSTWAVWWTGDAMGVLVVAPFLLCIPLFWEQRRLRLGGWLEESAILIVIAAVSAWAALAESPVLFLALPLLGWASWRYQLRGAAPAALIASLLATWAAANPTRLFDRGSLLQTMLALQAFNACVALTSFFLAALVSERLRVEAALEVSAAELEDRVRRRTADVTAANARLQLEKRERSEAQLQLRLEAARSHREHEIAETLQRSLLPKRIPSIPGVALAARYVPATSDVEVGGDWYDVIQLANGLIGLAIGDVAGHGLQAAATMGQLRMALRAYSLQDSSPAVVVAGVHRLARHLPLPEMATLIYLVFDPANGVMRFTNAGHPPALVISNGTGRYLDDALSPPLGVTADDQFDEGRVQFPHGSTLLLYTDGLVERKGVSIQVGLDRLSELAVTYASSDVDELCDHLLSYLGESDHGDDIAVLAMRAAQADLAPLSLRLRAEPRALAEMRQALRLWLRQSLVASADEGEIVVACGEACANVVQHAYAASPGLMEIDALRLGNTVEVTVRDRGGWRPPADRSGGWGVSLMEALMDSVVLERGVDGTTVKMSRRLSVAGNR
ncbi:MAG: SpoIIE family protein phosphatase [Nocardioidaceae bacterium]